MKTRVAITAALITVLNSLRFKQRRWLIATPSIVLALLFGRNAQAENILINGTPQDVWFQFDTEQVFTVRTYAVNVFSDPMLWLYDSNNVLIASNDDWFGLQSHIQINVTAGAYRLRAGFCCGDPNAVRPGQRYEVGSSAIPVPTTVETSTSLQESTTTIVDTTSVSTMQETSSTTTTTVAQTTTTQEPTTTTQYVAPTTTVLAPSSSDLPSTSLPPTTLQQSTTTSVASETTLPEPTTTTAVPETIQTTAVSTSIPETTSSVPPVTVSNVSTSTANVTTTLTTFPPKPQPTTPPQTSTTTPTLPPVQSTNVTPLTTAPPETLETTTTTTPEAAVTFDDATNPDVLTEQMTQAVADADTPAKRAALTKQLNTAPDAAKQIFEQQVNVYSGNWDTYVPAGSRIPVGERRTLIAVMGGLVSLASTAPRRKN